MPRPFHSSRFYHPHNIGWGVQSINPLKTKCRPLHLNSQSVPHSKQNSS
jgi:hypothetical protein